MGLKNIFKIKRWVPDLERSPPPKRDWPDHIITLSNKKFDDFINKYPVAIIDFWAPWCKPCKIIAPRIRQLSKMYKKKKFPDFWNAFMPNDKAPRAGELFNLPGQAKTLEVIADTKGEAFYSGI